MQTFNDQIQRIKDKLPEARKADKELNAFGASSHKYQLNNPVTEEEALKFEQGYSIRLPEDYRSFVLQVGSGGIEHEYSGAGPTRIYALGKGLDQLIPHIAGDYLKEACIIYPGMSDEYWASLTEDLRNNHHKMDESDYVDATGKIFGGILFMGDDVGIVLNGPHMGRVVHVDSYEYKPVFASENNFLDWYEQWLDGIISGELISPYSNRFDHTMAGTDIETIRAFVDSNIPGEQDNCLYTLLRREEITATTIQIIEAQLSTNAGKYKELLLQILTKFDYQKAKPHLIEYSQTKLAYALIFVNTYAKDRCIEWITLIYEHIDSINDYGTFNACLHLLHTAGIESGQLLVQFAQKKDEHIRISALYALGKLEDKADFLDAFIQGLADDAPLVVDAALQALAGIKDPRLPVLYAQIAEKFAGEKGKRIYYLAERLAEYGLTHKKN
ncbi:SMI1/KNR4 family protein [Chitinophaga agrisoli]|uniref:SMI1/KNR4 family protein n=1 Tax=Chitinophaga agrisoli TaxID=2607653 RepID=A0A5B2VPP4_9BACT|nr:SMI1/KNR4 family protein [Chitinophaga agrisoli]KAA2240694.1 SMI1/KNR4 family protein [Chitinophaga agrisoli]